jgi:hypothetical protein
MLGIDIIKALKEEPDVYPSFSGIYAVDTIPKMLKDNSFIIINKSVVSSPGSHWFACFTYNHQLQIFDSLGVDKTFVEEKLNKWKHSDFEYNETQLQPDNSQSCGGFVIYASVCRCLNPDISFENLMSHIFTCDPIKNEEIVTNYLSTKDFFEN